MRKGENIFKRKDGRWEARYIKAHDLSGKAQYGFCYGKTYREAKEKVMKRKVALLEGKPIPQSGTNHRFSFYCGQWLAFQKARIRESTFVKYDTFLCKHILPKLGNCCPSGLTGSVIDRFSEELLTAGLSEKTVHDILVVLHGILKYSAGQFPGIFPVISIHYPKEHRKEMRVLSQCEQTFFIAFLVKEMDPCKFGVLLMLLSGMRIGELCALKWENIDLQARTIRIRATIQRLRNDTDEASGRTRIVIGAPKSDTSARTIPLTEYAAGLCRRWAVSNGNAYILTGTEKFMEPRTLQYRMEKYTRQCGLENVHPHTLRHTFATRALEVGFDIKSLSEILGHASTTITLERYVHSSMELKRANMDKLSAVGL